MELKLEKEPITKDCLTATPEIRVPEESSLNELINEDPVVSNSVASELPLRISTRKIVKPERYGFSLVSVATEQHDPTSLAEAIPIPDEAKWQASLAL